MNCSECGKKLGSCERCGMDPWKGQLYHFNPNQEEKENGSKPLHICWDCDFTVINSRGGLYDEVDPEEWEERFHAYD